MSGGGGGVFEVFEVFEDMRRVLIGEVQGEVRSLSFFPR